FRPTPSLTGALPGTAPVGPYWQAPRARLPTATPPEGAVRPSAQGATCLPSRPHDQRRCGSGLGGLQRPASRRGPTTHDLPTRPHNPAQAGAFGAPPHQSPTLSTRRP